MILEMICPSGFGEWAKMCSKTKTLDPEWPQLDTWLMAKAKKTLDLYITNIYPHTTV